MEIRLPAAASERGDGRPKEFFPARPKAGQSLADMMVKLCG
jgi:hypothetical protein